jgi:hypothetical protein
MEAFYPVARGDAPDPKSVSSRRGDLAELCNDQGAVGHQ